jgi:NAD(P)-dependent dehydrogenase (short-subunit alcohol dehydrogenase family)
MRFDGKVAMVTGAARGMGASHALGFAREGADVVVLDVAKNIPSLMCDQGTNAELEQVVDEIKKMGRRAIGVVANISHNTEVKAAVDKAVSEFGKIDILVNNVGVCILGYPLINYTEEQIDTMLDINVKGTIFCCQQVIPHMAKQKYGKIINILSNAGLHAEPMVSVYAASKYAIRGLTEALAAELCHYNINVNAVAPGSVFTAGSKVLSTKLFPGSDAQAAYQSYCDEHHYFRREITEQDVTNAVLFLASDEARNITSHILTVTAGAEKKTPAHDPYFIM